MAANQGDLKNKLAQRAQERSVTGAAGTQTIDDLLKRAMPAIERVLPKHLSAERLLQVVTTAIKTTPKLRECTSFSLLAAVMQSAQLGLFPGPLGHCYYVPFYNSKKQVYEVQFIVGYKGLIDLARRSGHLESIEAHEVCENDHFEVEYGLHPKLIHKVDPKKPRGQAYAYYGIARYKDGGYSYLVMSREDIERHRARSKAADNGPWVTDYDEMAKKTVIRALSKYMPMSVDYATALAVDGTVKEKVDLETGEIIDEQDVLNAEYTVVDDEQNTTGEAQADGQGR